MNGKAAAVRTMGSPSLLGTTTSSLLAGGSAALSSYGLIGHEEKYRALFSRHRTFRKKVGLAF
jgi:hypothetical protein